MHRHFAPKPADRAVIDPGSKALTSDLQGFNDYGLIVGYPQARITSLSEEHGVIDLSNCTGPRPQIGEKLFIIPNHTCVVSNCSIRWCFTGGRGDACRGSRRPRPRLVAAGFG